MTDKYYKTPAGQVYIGVRVSNDDIELTEVQYNEVRQQMAIIDARSQRDQRIASFRWRIERHNDEVAMGIEPTEPIEPLLSYIQALRDVPLQEGFPQNIVWPEIPAQE